MSPPTLAFIFDLDGVITDTARLHFLAWRSLAASVGVPFDEVFNERLKGISRMDSLEMILGCARRAYTPAEKAALAERKNDDYVRLIATITPAELLPGAVEALRGARDAGCRVALASASRNAAAVLERLGIAAMFDHVVDANEVARSKPDPEVFLAAAAALGVAPADCVGIEDAVAGIEAVVGAGMFALGVGDARVLSKADQVIPDLRAFVPSNYQRPGQRLRWRTEP